jgi:uncharacterized protein YndB with AHSA1/START domain
MERVTVELEFLFRASPTILYQFLTTPSCLVRWFSDKVDIDGEDYKFTWAGFSERAELVDDYEEELLRFRWEEAESDDEYLEFHISTSPITNETILRIKDVCDADEVEDQKSYWESNIKKLKNAIGG